MEMNRIRRLVGADGVVTVYYQKPMDNEMNWTMLWSETSKQIDLSKDPNNWSFARIIFVRRVA